MSAIEAGVFTGRGSEPTQPPCPSLDTKYLRAPFPYFGGKSKVADIVWRALGENVGHYIEPFCGSCAVLFKRPGQYWRTNAETVNDADGLIANTWRGVRLAPEEVIHWADWPVNHADLNARQKALREAAPALLERLNADAEYCDAKLAGYYVWAASCWIGNMQDAHRIPAIAGYGNGIHGRTARGHVADWIHTLCERLRYVRVVCGDWSRVCGGSWQPIGGQPVGMFFDPPYSVADRARGLYRIDSRETANAVDAWCRERGKSPDYRIVLAGYYEEHESLLSDGWRAERWKANGGYGNQATTENRNRMREALFFSPHCLPVNLFDPA